MQVADFQLRLQVHAIVVERALAVLLLLAALAHHDDGRLDGGQTRQDQIEQDERIRVEGFLVAAPDVDGHPDDKHDGEGDQERPGAAETRQMVGQALAETALLLVFNLGVFRDRVVAGDALGHFAVEFGELAVLLLQQLLEIEHAIARKLAEADPRVLRQVGMVAPNALRQRRAQVIDIDQLTLAIFASRDRRGELASTPTPRTGLLGVGRGDGFELFVVDVVLGRPGAWPRFVAHVGVLRSDAARRRRRRRSLMRLYAPSGLSTL